MVKLNCSQTNCSAEAFDQTENVVANFDFAIIVNKKDTLDGKTFSPTETGRYIVHAVANNVESLEIAIDFIKPSDITKLKLYYQGYQYLTTEPWSVSGDFILTTSTLARNRKAYQTYFRPNYSS